MKDQFIKIIKSIIDLPAEQETEVLKNCTIKHIKKGEHFINAGDIPDKFAFNLQGLFRYYYIDKKGNDFTKGFMPEGSTLSSYSAMIQKRESFFYIEALEDSIIAVLNYNDWKRLLNSHVCWKLFLISLLEKGYCVKESRERELLIHDAEERYNIFRQTFSNIEHRLKQRYIASYLGITPVALSRIRKKMGLINIG
jgi:CRP-like cAMP-binding protein